MAIADMVGNDKVNISKDKNLTCLLDSFHSDKPEGRLVLHQLSKAPLEPFRKASLKHLTFKTVFLLALGSGKRRSEIHVWLYKNIRHQENWSQVSLYPSPSFLSKNQLSREEPVCVAPVVIPALAPSLDKSLSRRILFLPLSLPGSNKQCFYATSSQMRKPRTYIKLELMMSGPLQLPRHSKEGFP